MEKYLWAAAVIVEAAYVLSVLLGELISLLLHRRVTNFERRLHELPEDRYFSGFMTPLLGSLAGGCTERFFQPGCGVRQLDPSATRRNSW